MRADSPFGFSLAASGAVVFGSNHRMTTSTVFLSTTSTDTSVAETIVDLEAAAGLDFHVTDQAVFTAGYRAEVLSGVNNFGSNAPAGQLVHGPFEKLKAQF